MVPSPHHCQDSSIVKCCYLNCLPSFSSIYFTTWAGTSSAETFPASQSANGGLSLPGGCSSPTCDSRKNRCHGSPQMKQILPASHHTYLRSIELDLVNLDSATKWHNLDEWKDQMQAGLPALRSLKLRSGPEIAPSPSRSPIICAFYFGQPILDILSVQNLTSLEFDTAESCLLGGFPEDSPHFCVALNSLMRNSPSLQRLHCRIDMMCERLLEVPDTPGHTNFNRNLSEVVVMLSLVEISRECLVCRHAKPCISAGGLGLTSPRNSLEQQATIFARRMHNPKMVRIIRRALPSLDLLVFNAVNQSRLRLDFFSKWDDHLPSKPLEDDEDFPPPEATPVAIYFSGES